MCPRFSYQQLAEEGPWRQSSFAALKCGKHSVLSTFQHLIYIAHKYVSGAGGLLPRALSRRSVLYCLTQRARSTFAPYRVSKISRQTECEMLHGWLGIPGHIHQ